MKMLGSGDASFIVKLRGLPFSTITQDVLDFLSGVNVLNGADGVHLTEIRPGRPTGECFVELQSEADVDKACKKDKEHMGPRYIEVFVSDQQEMAWALNSAAPGGPAALPPLDGGVVKLRGLPFGCSKDEIVQFFDGLGVSAEGVSILSDHAGRSSGEAFVHFVDKESAEKALDKDREKIGHRYIEVFRSSVAELRGAGPRPQRAAPYDRSDRYGRFGDRVRQPPQRNYRGGDFNGDSWARGGGGPWRGGREGHCVHMRGLPFKATLNDVAYFFKPVRPLNITLLFDNNNRPSGEADVEFECHEDAMRAMRKDRTAMEHRYIELFLNSAPGPRGGYWGQHPEKFGRNTFRN